MKAPTNRRTRRAPAQQPITPTAAEDAKLMVDEYWEETMKEDPSLLPRAAEQEPYEGPKNLLQEMREYLASVPANLPYEQLLEHADQAGWAWMIRQHGIHSVPYQYQIQPGQIAQGPGFLVSFAVLVGRKGGDLEYIDEVSVVLPAQAGPISVAARTQILPSLVYALFGRLPPPPPEQPRRQRTVEMPDEDVELEGVSAAGDVPEWQREDEPVTETSQRLNGGEALDVVARRTPDGLPIFADLYALDDSSIELVNAVINEVNDVLPSVTTVAGLNALWEHNGAAMTFVKDFGTVEQRQALGAMMKRRKGLIEAGLPEPRRRN